MKKFKNIALAFLGLLSIWFLSCKPETTTSFVEDDIGISITLPGGSNGRAVFYDIDEVASYKIIVDKNRNEVTRKDAAPGETVRIRLNDTGAYDITVIAYNSSSNVIASGFASITLVLGDGYKNVPIDIEPHEKYIGINFCAVWETPYEEKYGVADTVRYDISIYEGENLITTYEDVSLSGSSYEVPFYSTYKVKIEAKNANLTVIGSGEAEFTIEQGDTYKDVSVTIVGEYKQLLGVVGITPSLNWVAGYKRETVTFGTYPQSLADVTGITLTATGKIYDGSNAEYTGNDDNKYVRVGSSYYKVEPITWRVIGYNSDGSKKLLADKIYATIPYYGTTSSRDLSGTTIYANNYKYSNIRAYLNSTKNQFETDGGSPTEYEIDWTDSGFLTSAFTSVELAKIKTVLIDNRSEIYYDNQYACENTEDKVYLLSYMDTRKKLYGFNNNSDRIMKTTAYARANGAWHIDDEADGHWWLRSPHKNDDYASGSGYGNISGGRVDKDDFGVVPALTVTE